MEGEKADDDDGEEEDIEAAIRKETTELKSEKPFVSVKLEVECGKVPRPFNPSFFFFQDGGVLGG